jgi:two-component system capsular synthesis sensor histidine kinase RcsC
MSDAPPIAILAVDDEPGVLALVRRCLDDSRITLTTSLSAAAALAHLSAGERFELLITDMRMPEMEGDELARQFRVHDRNVKVLYLTSHAERLFDAKSQLWAAEAYLEKPFSRDALREAAAMLLFGHTTL